MLDRGILFVCLLASLILFLPLSVDSVQAETAPPPQLQSADPFVSDLFHRSRSTGMVVVVVRDNQTWMQSYGQTYPGSHQKPNADSLIRLCSLTKIMTTDLLVKLVAEGRVSLSDPLQKFAPRNVTVPDRTVRGLSGRPITLRDLATHTAGLPAKSRIPRAIPAISPFPTITFAGNGSLAIACVFFPEPPHIIPTSVSTCSRTLCPPPPAKPTRNSLPIESPNPLGCAIRP